MNLIYVKTSKENIYIYAGQCHVCANDEEDN